MRNVMIAAVALLCLVAGQAQAQDIEFVRGLTQSMFKDFSKEAGQALSYHNVAPSVALGLTGFDIAVEATAIDIKDTEYWDAAFGDDVPSYLLVPRVRVRKGLPFGIDIGAMYAYAPDTNVKLFGAELAYAVIDGGLVTPTLGLRGSYTKMTGVDDLDLQTIGIDACLSKGFLILTPYVGAGMVYIESKAKGDLQQLSTALTGSPLDDEKIWLPRYFGGLKLTPFPLFSITGEVEYVERPAYSLKAAINF